MPFFYFRESIRNLKEKKYCLLRGSFLMKMYYEVMKKTSSPLIERTGWLGGSDYGTTGVRVPEEGFEENVL